MKKNVNLMYAIALLHGMVFYAPVATLYRQMHGVSFFQITLIESISLALMIILEIPWGVIADKIGYRKTMIFCTGLLFLSKIVFWQADGFGGFLLERIMISVVFAGMSGVDSSIIYLSCKGEGDSQKAFGICSGFGMAGLLISSGVFSILIQDNYELAGLLTALSHGIAALLSFGLVEVKETDSKKEENTRFVEVLRQTMTNRKLILFLVAVALLSETHQTVTVFLNQLQYQRCGLGNSAMGYIYIVATVVGMCGVWSVAVTKKLGNKRSLVIFPFVAMLSCMILEMTHFAIPSIMAILMLRMANSLFQPFQSEIQQKQVKRGNRSTALSINAMLIDCIGIGTNLIFGALAQVKLSAAFSFGAAISIMSLFLFAAWGKNTLAK